MKKIKNLASNIFKHTLNQAVIFKAILFIIIFGATVNLRKSFITPYSYLFGQYSDFLTLYIYISDLGITCLTLLIIYYKLKHKFSTCQEISLRNVPYETWFLIIFGALFSASYLYHTFIGSNEIKSTASYSFISMLALLFIVINGKHLPVSEKSRVFFKKMLITGVLTTTLLAILQFFKQSSIGLPFHMEPIIHPGQAGVASINTPDGLILRTYGTFLHPNILAGVFCLALFYIVSQKEHLKNWIFWLTSLSIVSTISLSFSRTAVISLTASIAGLLAASLITKHKQLSQALFILLIFTVSLQLLLAPINLSRIPDSREAAITERLDYNKIGLNIIKNYPILGIGTSQSMIHMEHFASHPLKPWEHQPVHNYFLLMATEIGVPATLAFLGFLLILIYKNIKSGFFLKKTKSLIFLACLANILLLMQADHYLYTTKVGQIALWTAIFIIYNDSHETFQEKQ